MSQYGVTFAQKLIQHGDCEQAVVEAEKHMRLEPDSPEPYHDRARALASLGRYEEAVADYARAIELDRIEQILHDGEVDDGLFSTILAWCQALPGEAERLAVLGRYQALLPGGSHRDEAAEWALRFQGKLKTTFVKPRE
jgi:tetratricopeptide (TPR) repeat protein